MKKFFSNLITMGVLSLCTLSSTQAFAATGNLAQQSNSAISNVVVKFPDAKPFIDQHNHTQVPLRFLSESMGYNVHWQKNAGNIQVTLQNASKNIVLQTDDSTAYINGTAQSLESSPTLKDNRTYVPLRFVTEAFGSNVQWDKAQSDAIVTNGEKRLVIPVPRSIQPDAFSQTASSFKLIQSAEKWMGVPYVFGGSSISGFDCSGYVQYVFGQIGIHLPRTCAEMYQLGNPVQTLQPGDLVFFTTYKPGASHVGIYIGNNQFISATTSHGVSITNLQNPYWATRYIGAKRL